MTRKKRKHGGKQANGLSQPPQKRAKVDEDGANATIELLADKTPFPETPTAADRKREARLYELLGSEDAAERVAAAEVIVSALLAGGGVPQDVLQRHLDWRLFRGLASGRRASRLGFSLVLTEILSQLFGETALGASKYPELSFDKVFNLLVEKTTPGGGIPGQEERDHYLGQLFGVECFVRANIIFSDDSQWQKVLEILLKLAKKKSWLISQCGWVIVQAAERMPLKLAETTLHKIAEQGLSKTPEGVGIWIVILDRFPDVKRPSKSWRDPLESKYLGDLATALKDGGREAQGEEDTGLSAQRQANWTAQLHFVWDILLRRFVKLAASEAKSGTSPGTKLGAEQFKLFWNRVVDDTYFAKNASKQQKYSGFMVFVKMLEGLSAYELYVEKLFSKNFMACLMNQAANKDRYLHLAARKALKGVEAAVADQAFLAPTILRQLLSNHGTFNFDQRTNTRTIEKVLQPADHARAIIIVKEAFGNASTERGVDIQQQRLYGDYLLQMVKVLPNGERDLDGGSIPHGTRAAVHELTSLAFPKPQPFIESSQRSTVEFLRTRFMSALAKLAKQSEGHAFLVEAIVSIDDGAMAMSSEIRDEYVNALGRMDDLVKVGLRLPESAAQRATIDSLKLLHAVAILQLYNEEPDAVDVLSDLAQCYDKMRGAEWKGEASESLVEIILAMSARPSALLRQITLHVFESLTHMLTAGAVKLLADVLGAKESTQGQQALFSLEDEEAEGEEDDIESEASSDGDDIDGEMDSDVEFVGLQEASEVNGNENDESESGSDDEEVEDDDETQALEDLDDALAKVLRSHRLDKDADAESSSSESDMTDTAMLELDNTLADVFKKRVKNYSHKKEQKDARETVINFKHRVLDLLAIYLRKQAGLNEVPFSILIPLLELVRTTTTKALGNKASEMIAEFGKSLRKARGGKETPAQSAKALQKEKKYLMGILGDMHVEATKDPSHAFAKAAAAASLAIVSELFAADKDFIQDVAALYARTQADWVRGLVRVQPAFFSEWLNWCQSHAASAAATQKSTEDVEQT